MCFLKQFFITTLAFMTLFKVTRGLKKLDSTGGNRTTCNSVARGSLTAKQQALLYEQPKKTMKKKPECMVRYAG